jgi:hypothetical protein
VHKRRQGIAYTQCTLRHDEYEHKSLRRRSDSKQIALVRQLCGQRAHGIDTYMIHSEDS